MSDLLRQIDYHVHTVHSPCGKMGMDPVRILQIFSKFGFKSIGFTDHFDPENFDAIVRSIRDEVEASYAGLEVFYGTESSVVSPTSCTITREQAGKLDFVIAAPHHYSSPAGGIDATARALRDELWGRFFFVCGQDWIAAAAHPFHQGPQWHPMMTQALGLITDSMLEQAFELARQNNVAMELQPKAFGMEPQFRSRFFSTAVRVGVKIWIGSDTHSIPRIGATRELLPLVREFGITDDMIKVLARK